MANLTRLKVLRCLARHDYATVEDLAAYFNCEKGTIWRHLRAAVRGGLASALGENHIRYIISDAGDRLVKEEDAAARTTSVPG